MVYCTMRLEHLKEVLIIEESVYDNPWTEKQFRNIISNIHAKCFVAIVKNEVAGYMILFYSKTEWSIENLTVAPDYRRNALIVEILQLDCYCY